MRYLLDANVLIDADRDYYPLERVPQFWEWLLHVAAEGRVSVPQEVFDEVAQGTGRLVDWLRANRDTLRSKSEVSPGLVTEAVDRGYAEDLNDAEIESSAPMLSWSPMRSPNRVRPP